MNVAEKLKSKKILFATWSCSIKDYYQNRDWMPLMKKTFGKMVVFSPRDNYYKYGKERMNEMFIEIVRREKPDMIMLSLSYDEFYLETFEKIKKISPKTIMINFFGDDDWRYEDWSRYYAFYFDYNLSAKKDISPYLKDGIKNVDFFWGINPDVLKPIKIEKKYDVTFIGSPVADRYEYIKYLKENGVNIKLFGPGWADYPEFNDIYLGFLSSEDFVKVINESKINLNFTKTFYEKGKKGQFKGRIFEIAACNAFQLVESSPMIVGYYKDNEKVNFSEKKELLNKIRYYLENEQKRKEIAGEAYREAIEKYTWNTQFAKLFDEIYTKNKTIIPSVGGRIAVINSKDFSDINLIRKKVAGADYVKFSDSLVSQDSKREFAQIYSLNKSEKVISCCDAVIRKNGIDNFLVMNAKKAFNTLKKEKFNNLVQLGQLIIKKKYFIDNLSRFRNFADGKKEEIINEENTSFVSIPLVELRDFKKTEYKDMLIAYQMRFRDRLYSIAKRREIFSAYPYKIIIDGIFGDWFVIKYLFKSIFNRDNWLRLKGKI